MSVCLGARSKDDVGENLLFDAVGITEGERLKSVGIEASYKSSGFFFFY